MENLDKHEIATEVLSLAIRVPQAAGFCEKRNLADVRADKEET
jgi:hypothetical protein